MRDLMAHVDEVRGHVQLFCHVEHGHLECSALLRVTIARDKPVMTVSLYIYSKFSVADAEMISPGECSTVDGTNVEYRVLFHIMMEDSINQQSRGLNGMRDVPSQLPNIDLAQALERYVKQRGMSFVRD